MKYSEKLKEYIGIKGYFNEAGNELTFGKIVFGVLMTNDSVIKEVGDDFVVVSYYEENDYEKKHLIAVIPLSLFIIKIQT